MSLPAGCKVFWLLLALLLHCLSILCVAWGQVMLVLVLRLGMLCWCADGFGCSKFWVQICCHCQQLLAVLLAVGYLVTRAGR